jgi:hypothetical protein
LPNPKTIANQQSSAKPSLKILNTTNPKQPNPNKITNQKSSAKPNPNQNKRKPNPRVWNEFVKVDGKLQLMQTTDLGMKKTTKYDRKIPPTQPTLNILATPTTPARSQNPRRKVEISTNPPLTPRTLHLQRLAKKITKPKPKLSNLQPTKPAAATWTSSRPTEYSTKSSTISPTRLPTIAKPKPTESESRSKCQEYPSRPTAVHLESTVKNRIALLERECISQREEIFQESLNLPKPEKGD